ncbi:MAG: tetratricopeptide repeat protein [Mangrovibacterium sp.]
MNQVYNLSKKLLLFYALSFIFSFAIPHNALAQTKVNADSLFLVARQYSFDGKYNKALQISDLILSQNPNYFDVSLLKSRIYSWQGDYTTAEKIASDVLTLDPKNYDAYDALSNIYLWNNQSEECILTINRALYFFEDDINLLIKKTKALLPLKNYDEAQETINRLLELDPQNPAIKKLQDRINLEASGNATTINLDSLFSVANSYAMKKEYTKARNTASEVLAIYPKYTDAQLLIARTQAWEGDYASAQKEVSDVLSKDAKNYDAISLQSDIYFWNGEYDQCILFITQAQSIYPKDISLLTKKFKAQVALNDNESANETLKMLEVLDPENSVLKDEKEKIALSKPYKNIIKVEYNYETFKKPWERMWSMTGLSYGRRTSKYGDYYANIFMGDLILPGEKFGSDLGLQFELECYPKIDNNNTFFFAYAYSPSPIFATHRLGVEYYRSFPNIIDASLGYRFMNFSTDVEEIVNVNVLTTSISKYLGNYWLSFRPYAVFVSNVDKVNSSYQIIGRKYLARPESFIGLTLGYGVSSPDDSFFQNNAGTAPLYKTYTTQAQFKYKLSSLLIIDSYLGYENAEYKPNSHRGQINFRIAIQCLL